MRPKSRAVLGLFAEDEKPSGELTEVDPLTLAGSGSPAPPGLDKLQTPQRRVIKTPIAAHNYQSDGDYQLPTCPSTEASTALRSVDPARAPPPHASFSHTSNRTGSPPPRRRRRRPVQRPTEPSFDASHVVAVPRSDRQRTVKDRPTCRAAALNRSSPHDFPPRRHPTPPHLPSSSFPVDKIQLPVLARSRQKMMSIFSSFDALCAESRGQKVTFSFSPAKAQKPADSPAPAAAEKAKSAAGGKPLPPAPKQPQQKKRAPRFAPELDGVHCFETILPY
ncbi:hypothetical protein NL676_017852 [Syzygium grande]|nr:hypothetical protein NL676_017852 [Syzygium grande]